MTAQQPLTPELEIGQHVLYIEGAKVKDALILVKFSERTWPSLTLVVVRPSAYGERGMMVKSCVPHETRFKSGRGYWRLASVLAEPALAEMEVSKYGK